MDLVRSRTEYLHFRHVDTRIYIANWQPCFQYQACTDIVPSTSDRVFACATIQAHSFDYPFIESFLGYVLRHDECYSFTDSLHNMVFACTSCAISWKRW